MGLLEKEKKLKNDWAKIYENCQTFIGEANLAVGQHNFYGTGTTR